MSTQAFDSQQRRAAVRKGFHRFIPHHNLTDRGCAGCAGPSPPSAQAASQCRDAHKRQWTLHTNMSRARDRQQVEPCAISLPRANHSENSGGRIACAPGRLKLRCGRCRREGLDARRRGYSILQPQSCRSAPRSRDAPATVQIDFGHCHRISPADMPTLMKQPSPELDGVGRMMATPQTLRSSAPRGGGRRLRSFDTAADGRYPPESRCCHTIACLSETRCAAPALHAIRSPQRPADSPVSPRAPPPSSPRSSSTAPGWAIRWPLRRYSLFPRPGENRLSLSAICSVNYQADYWGRADEDAGDTAKPEFSKKAGAMRRADSAALMTLGISRWLIAFRAKRVRSC